MISSKNIIIKDRSWTEINLDNFAYNLEQIKKFFLPHQSFIQIVKADAYGHGSVQIARKAVECGARMLGVANTEEAVMLRFQNINTDILILSPSLESEIESIFEYKLIPSVSNLAFAGKLNQYCRERDFIQKVHIKCDTGMNRNGVRINDLPGFIQAVQEFDNLEIDGVFSHFSASENDEEFTLNQYRLFSESLKKIKVSIPNIHIANSSAAVKYKFAETNLLRLGLLSYGIYTDESIKDLIDLKPVMQFKSRISHISRALPDESIGYNRLFKVRKVTDYAIIPVGYADGYDFLLSDKACVYLNGQVCNVLGKISMDMTAIDVSDLKNIQIGDEVTLLGNASKYIRAEYLSSLYKGSSYELLCQIGRRARRYFIEDAMINDNDPILRREFIPRDFSDDKLNKIIHSAIEERIQKKELASVIYHDILKYFFIDSDRDVSYRSDFVHSIKFSEHHNHDYREYYKVEASIEFSKILHNNLFIVACANDQKTLEKYFRRRDTEYRWLLDEKIMISRDVFSIEKVSVDNITLNTESCFKSNSIEFECSSPQLNDLIGKQVRFKINTVTYYPKKSHQLSIYLTEITKGIELSFEYPPCIETVESVPIFSGKNKYPQIEYSENKIRLFSGKNEWIFPNSGIVFSY
jgi:alanine racemase